jgi:hypothetical protein
MTGERAFRVGLMWRGQRATLPGAGQCARNIHLANLALGTKLPYNHVSQQN